jgi:hypothetical protein
MTTIERPREIWSTMPGWGIVANLTPPELIAARKLKSIRKIFAGVLVVILVIGVGLYATAFLSHRSAAADLAAEQGRTTSLTAQQHQYQGAVRVQGSITEVQSQLAGLLTDDVDMSSLVGALRAKLPSGMTITQVALNIQTGLAGASAAAGGSALDTSGQQHIGAVTIAGNGHRISDISAYVDALASVPGVVTPYPTSTTASAKLVQWSIQLTLSSDLLTHRYDVTKNGVK